MISSHLLFLSIHTCALQAATVIKPPSLILSLVRLAPHLRLLHLCRMAVNSPVSAVMQSTHAVAGLTAYTCMKVQLLD